MSEHTTNSDGALETSDILPYLVDAGSLTESEVTTVAARPESAEASLEELASLGVLNRTENGWTVADESLLTAFA